MRILPAALALLLIAPAAAHAAPVPDRVVAEVTGPMGIGVDGPLLAYSHRVGGSGVEVVVQDGTAPAVRLPGGASRRGLPVDVGRDAGGRRLAAYATCRAGRCELRTVVPGQAPRLVVRTRVPSDLTVGGGRLFWAVGTQVRSRALTGGPIRREAVVEGFGPGLELDTDGRTLAVTGDHVPAGTDPQGGTGLSVTRVGSGRARLRATRSFGEEYVAFRAPVVTRAGVTTLYDEGTIGVSRRFARFDAGERSYLTPSTGGQHLLTWDAAGGRAAYVEGPSSGGCSLGSDAEATFVADAPCRVVVGAAGGQRLLTPRLAVRGRSARLARATLGPTGIAGTTGLAGVEVELRHAGTRFGTLTTDATGRITLPADDPEPTVLVARTTPPTYASYGNGS